MSTLIFKKWRIKKYSWSADPSIIHTMKTIKLSGPKVQAVPRRKKNPIPNTLSDDDARMFRARVRYSSILP